MCKRHLPIILDEIRALGEYELGGSQFHSGGERRAGHIIAMGTKCTQIGLP